MKGSAYNQAGAILGGAATEAGVPVFQYHLERGPSGKIVSRQERGPQGAHIWEYAYDSDGRLTTVHKNGLLAEFYQYDEGGRREQDFRAWAGERRLFTYYYDGSLVRVNGIELTWTEQGQLASITENGRTDRFDYGRDTRLDQATLADGSRIRYEYGSELLPVRVLVNGRVAAEYVWQDMLCLSRHKDCESSLTHEFVYGHDRVPEKVILRGPAGAVQAATGIYASELVLNIWADQVESVRALSLPDGRPLKFLEYDAFGHVALDTRPEWRFPLGFACGLNDPWTGFVRFGFRDYDSRFGRFTARDPLGDTGGDHDLWEYCVDDPVNAVDATGLMGRALKGKLRNNIFMEMANPKSLGEPERIIDLHNEIQGINGRANAGQLSDEDYHRLWELRRNELELKKKYKEHYQTKSWQDYFERR